MDYNISLASLFWLVGGVASIVALFKILYKPIDQLSDHERRLRKLEDDRAERRETDLLTLQTLNAMVNHMIDGNGIDSLKKVRDDLQKSIIDAHK